MAKPLENVAFWLPGLGPPAPSRASPSRRVSERSGSREDAGSTLGASPVSRQSSLRSKERPFTSGAPVQSSRLKLTCPVKLPSLGRSPRGSQTVRGPRQGSKESKGSPARQSSLEFGLERSREPSRKSKTRSATATLGVEASPAHSMSMLSTDSTDASPHISYDVLRLAEEANNPGDPSMPSGGGSMPGAVSQSEGSSRRSSPSFAEKSDVEDVVDDLADRSFSIEGIPDLELVRASPDTHKGGYADGVVPSAPLDAPSRGGLQLPKAVSHVPTRAWGSTATVDTAKEDASPAGSPLKARRTYRRHQTAPGQSRSQTEELIGRKIESLAGQKIYDVYYWEQVIQEDGDGGKVVVCRKKNQANAGDFDKVMKIKSKLKLKKEGCEEDYRKVLLKMLALPLHPGVMPVEEALEDDAFYYVVTPRATSSFFDGLLVEFHDGVVPECALRSLMTDMLEAVDHLHSHGVLHRDIKPDNMVLQTDVNEQTGEKRRRVVLIDFDHADPDFHNNADEQERIYGTRRFNAPESYLCSFSRQTDLFSIGVIFYMLMTGKMPYDDEIFDGIKPPGSRMVSPRALLNDTFQRLKEADIDWNCDPWPSQPLSMDLCRQLLAFNPALRPSSARAALGHAWFLD